LIALRKNKAALVYGSFWQVNREHEEADKSIKLRPYETRIYEI
jgi:hypothetical protein